MSGNSFGKIFRVTTFGESHGEALGCIIDGCPAGIPIDVEKIQKALNRRRPGAKQLDTAGKEILNVAVTARSESDTAEILSGVFLDTSLNTKGFSTTADAQQIPVSTGTPIAILIRNTSQHSKDYSNLKETFRPGHADFTYQQKYGIRDYFGGGRSSGRETAARVAAGAVAQMVIDNIYETMASPEPSRIIAWTQEAAGIKSPEFFSPDYPTSNSFDSKTHSIADKIHELQEIVDSNIMRTPDTATAIKMEKAIAKYRKKGNSAGGIIRCVATGFSAGLGEPVFDKLDAELAKAMLSIGAVKGIEFGSGFESARMTGSEWNDSMRIKQSNQQPASSIPIFETNHSGGILGGLSTGSPIVFDIAVKPVPSIFIQQKTIKYNTNENEQKNIIQKLENTDLQIQGRHDVCLCPRIIPVVEAMTSIVLADMLLRNRSTRR